MKDDTCTVQPVIYMMMPYHEHVRTMRIVHPYANRASFADIPR